MKQQKTPQELFHLIRKRSELMTVEEVNALLQDQGNSFNYKSFDFKKILIIMSILSIVTVFYFLSSGSQVELTEVIPVYEPKISIEEESVAGFDNEDVSDSLVLVQQVEGANEIEYLPISKVPLSLVTLENYDEDLEEEMIEDIQVPSSDDLYAQEITWNWDKKNSYLLTHETTKKELKELEKQIENDSNGKVKLKVTFVYRKQGRTKNIELNFYNYDEKGEQVYEHKFYARTDNYDVEIGWTEANGKFQSFYHSYDVTDTRIEVTEREYWHCPPSPENKAFIEKSVQLHDSTIAEGDYQIIIHHDTSKETLDSLLSFAESKGLKITLKNHSEYLNTIFLKSQSVYGAGWRVKLKKNPAIISWKVTENHLLERAVITLGNKNNYFNFRKISADVLEVHCKCVN